MSAMMSGTMSVMGVFSANLESQWTLSVRFFTTVCQQILTAIKPLLMTILFLAGRHNGTSCMQHTQTAEERTLNFTSFFNLAFKLTAQQ